MAMHVSITGWIALACGVLAAAILIAYLVRRPPLTSGVKGALFVGLGVLPILTAMLGNIEGWHATKTHEFCGSCHVMERHLEDAEDPFSTSLAAVHSRNANFGNESCYVCHAEYVMFGPIVTKLNGMVQALHYITDYRTMPVDEAVLKMGLFKPYPNSNCIRCHTTRSPFFTQQPDHHGLLEDLRTGQTSCVSAGCHGYAHPFSKQPEEDP